ADGADAYVGGLRAAIREGGYEVVIPGDDFGILTISARRDELDAVVPYPAHEAVERAVDKLELAGVAERCGVPVPKTVEATQEAIASAELPCVVKPARHDGAGRVRPLLASTRGQVEAHAAAIEAFGGRPLLQAAVEGGLMAYSFVAGRDGSIHAEFQQDDVGRWPLPLGVSSRARRMAVDPELAAGAAALAAEIGWFGLAQLQFLRGPAGPVLIDWNARPYASMMLAIASGVNAVGIWARLATGRGLPEAAPQRDDVVFQWLPGDLRASAAARGRLRGVGDALRVAATAQHAIWQRSDPWPALRHYPKSLLLEALRRPRIHDAQYRPAARQPEPAAAAPIRPPSAPAARRAARTRGPRRASRRSPGSSSARPTARRRLRARTRPASARASRRSRTRTPGRAGAPARAP